MTRWTYNKGLQQIADGIYAYLQPPGTWGWSNAGLISDNGTSLLVDTLFDLDLTREMLIAMKAATPAADSIDILVNTHVNGDHCNGNQLVTGAEIIASKACAEEFAVETSPQLMADLLKNASQMGQLGRYFARSFGRFNFEGITRTPPTRTFEKYMDLKVGRKQVQLIQVGPCHTKGDIMVFVPQDRVLFTGDILFVGGTPIMWEGPVENWIGACDRILEMDVETIVPGHGAIAEKAGVRETKAYWQDLREEASEYYKRGMSAKEAATEMLRGKDAVWTDPERIVINMAAMYRAFKGDPEPLNRIELFEIMAEISMT